MSAALLKLLRADVAVDEARVIDGRLAVRMDRRAPSDDWTRVDRLIGEFGGPKRKARRRRAA